MTVKKKQKNIPQVKGTKPSQNQIKIKEPKNINKILAGIIFIFAFALYANSLWNNYAFDDDVICLKNKYVQNKLGNVKEIFTKGFTYAFDGNNTGSYRPMTLLSTALEVNFYGNKPHRHHFINVLLFSITCVVLFLLLRKLFSNYNYILPLLITLIYIAHPIHTEVVANIKSRDEILCFMFFIFSLYLIMDYVQNNRMISLIGSCVMYLLSLLSKENAFTFFLIYPLVIYYFTKAPLKKVLTISIPFIIVLLIYFMMRRSALDVMFFKTKIDVINNSLMAAQNSSDRLATAFSMLGKYFMLLLFPVTLSCDYSYNSNPIITWANIRAILPFLVYAGSLVYAIITFKKKNYYSFAILFFMITIATVANIFEIIGSSMAERFLFTPSLGFCIILGLALVKLFRIDITGNKRGSGFTMLSILMIIVLSAYSFKTISRNTDWKDNDHLFFADVKNSPNSFRMHNAVASTVRVRGENEKEPVKKKELITNAIDEYNKSLSILPQQSESWYNIGVCYYTINDIPNAINSYNRCIEVDSNYKAAYNNMGVIYFSKTDYDKAYYYFNKAVILDPNFADGIANIGAVFHNKGKYDEAIKYYEKALELVPNNPNVFNNLIRIYEFRKDTAKANFYKRKMGKI
ncbi:MAG: tetratricopeptide repeat protein [Bacteroidota bacterium]|nr:tetratricopeptide repeat protein [Bacteroidota bacterium]